MSTLREFERSQQEEEERTPQVAAYNDEQLETATNAMAIAQPAQPTTSFPTWAIVLGVVMAVLVVALLFVGSEKKKEHAPNASMFTDVGAPPPASASRQMTPMRSDGIEAALRGRVPMLMFFFLEGCGPCHSLMQVMNQVVASGKVPIPVCIAEHSTLSADIVRAFDLGSRGYPTLAVINASDPGSIEYCVNLSAHGIIDFVRSRLRGHSASQ